LYSNVRLLLEEFKNFSRFILTYTFIVHERHNKF